MNWHFLTNNYSVHDYLHNYCCLVACSQVKLAVNLIMELILKNVQKKHLMLIAELARTLKIEIETSGEAAGYDAEFISKIKRSEEDFKAGKYKAIKTSDLWK